MHQHLSPHIVAIAHASEDEERLRLTESCPQCRRAAEVFDDWTLLANHPDPRVAGEMDVAHGQLRRLREMPFEQALRRLAVDDELHRWGLARRALLTARRLLSDLPGEPERTARATAQTAYEHARIAVEVVYQLDWEFYGSGHWAGLLEQVLEALAETLKAREAPVRVEGLLDRLFDLLLEVSMASEGMVSQALRPPDESTEEPG